MTAVTMALPSRARLYRRAFNAMLRRDLVVLRRELPSFVMRVAIQPLFLLFVFGRIVTGLGYATGDYGRLLFPGLLALVAVTTAMQGIAAPLMVEFGYTREIEDRILAPVPIALVGLEKVLFAVVSAVGSALLMLPAGILVMGSIPWRWDGAPLLALVIVLGAITGAGLGLFIGSAVGAEKIGIMLTLVFPALMFTGASQYPWPLLSHLRWFQVVTSANPITYVSEGSRAALVPQIPHIAGWICALVLLATSIGTVVLGCVFFQRKVVK